MPIHDRCTLKATFRVLTSLSFCSFSTWKDGNTALTFASMKGHIEVAKILLNEGADKEATDNVSQASLLSISLFCTPSNGSWTHLVHWRETKFKLCFSQIQ